MIAAMSARFLPIGITARTAFKACGNLRLSQANKKRNGIKAC